NKSVLYLTKNGWLALDTAKANEKRTAGETLIPFNKAEIKTLLKTDNVVTRELVNRSVFVDTVEQTLKMNTENPLQRAKIALGLKPKTDGIAQRHWQQFGLDSLYKELQPEGGYKGDVEKLKEAAKLNVEIGRYREPLQQAVTQETAKLVFDAPFAINREPKLISQDAVPDDHAALRDPTAAAYSHTNTSINGDAKSVERCKGYIDEGEVSGDYCGTEHYDTHSIAYVFDSAGNEEKDYQGAKAAAHDISQGVNKLIKESGNDPAAMKKGLADLLEKVHFNQLLRGKNETGNKVTMALNIRINCDDGRQLLLGCTVGDARLLYVSRDGTVENMTTSSFFKPYPDSGGSLGDTKLDSKAGGGHAIQMFARYMQPGDEAVGFSDGAEILEPKSNTQSPLAAYEELEQAGKAPALKTAKNHLPTQVIDWTDKKWEGIKEGHPDFALKQDLQAIHDASIQLHAEAAVRKNENRAQAIFDHVTQAEITDLGKQVQIYDKERKHTNEKTNNVLDEIFRTDQEYLTENAKISQETTAAIRENVIAARWQAGFIKELLSFLNRPAREASINAKVVSETNNTKDPANIALKEAATKKLSALKESVRNKPENMERINDTKDEITRELLENDTKRLELAKKIAAKNNMNPQVMEQLQNDHFVFTNEYSHMRPDERPEGFKYDPLDLFLANNIGKPDDLGVFTLSATSLEELGRRIRQKPLPPTPNG
ncbi:MAG: hypothetical protein LLF94_06415, partial [Chlamydiales bacterium]|nr:hypothetical protein [Chlamydiales bacterium]